MNIIVTTTNLHIEDSYQVKSKNEMKDIINKFKRDFPEHVLTKVPTYLLVAEWASHNLCYKLGIYKERTKDADLNIDKPYYMNIVYLICSLFYI